MSLLMSLSYMYLSIKLIRRSWFTVSKNLDKSKSITCVITSYSIHYTKLYEGFWGAEASGINKTKVDSISFYLWEDKPDATANTFIVDNIRLNSDTSIPANMPAISFEEGEDLAYMTPQKRNNFV